MQRKEVRRDLDDYLREKEITEEQFYINLEAEAEVRSVYNFIIYLNEEGEPN